MHEGIKYDKYPCSKCDYKANTRGNLVIHIKSIHEGVNYPCNHCDYKATQKSNLMRHFKLKHEVPMQSL